MTLAKAWTHYTGIIHDDHHTAIFMVKAKRPQVSQVKMSTWL